jgi:recombination protein RecA
MSDSIYKIATKNKAIKDMMKESYYDVEDPDNIIKFISTDVIPMNLLLSGKLNGGIPIGKITVLSTPSMYGKTFAAMTSLKNAQKKGMTTIIIDTEATFEPEFAKSLGIDISKEKLFILQDNRIEKIIEFLLNIFNGMTKKERKNCFVAFDSWGVLVTSKTIEDGLNGKDVMDMTEAKKKNKLSNIILNTKATYLIINHVYANMGGFGEALNIPGGSKLIYNAHCVLLGTSRAKSKGKDEEGVDIIDGHIITAKTFKSRFSKGESKLKFRIKNDGGLDPFYGILDDAISCGVVEEAEGKSKKYFRKHIKDDKPLKETEIYNSGWWKPLILETNFKEYLETKYTFKSELDVIKQEKDLEEIFA